MGITSRHGTGWVKQEWCTAGSTYSLPDNKKTTVGKFGNRWWQPWMLWPGHGVQSSGRSGERKQQSEDLYSGTVVWVPWEVALESQLCQENVRSVRTAFFKQKSGPSHFCRELYQKILRKYVIQYLFTVLFKVSLRLKVSRMIDEAYVHIELYIYIHGFQCTNYITYFTSSQKVPSVGFFLPQTYFCLFFVMYCWVWCLNLRSTTF